MKKIIIAIDGHSSTGKGTVAKELAKELNYVYVDTGAMYRAITYFALINGFFENNILNKRRLIESLDDIELSFEYNQTKEKSVILLNEENVESHIRHMDISNKVSYVSKIPEVRHKLVKIQQKMGDNGGLVMDGRDIGSVVFPEAELKIFMTATDIERAKRRYSELKSSISNLNFDEVFANIKERDFIDSNRDTSPLIETEDVIKIDNTNLTKEKQLNKLLELANEKILKVNKNK